MKYGQCKYAMDLRPGDVLADDPDRDTPLHNGDPRIIQVSRTWAHVIDGVMSDTIALTFADGSITEFSTHAFAGPYRLEVS